MRPERQGLLDLHNPMMTDIALDETLSRCLYSPDAHYGIQNGVLGNEDVVING